MKNLYDLIIIGAGPAGLSAAIYAGRAKLKTLVIEKSDVGGQIGITSEVVNYPGIIRVSGSQLTKDMKNQAINFGVEFITDDVSQVNFKEDIKLVKTVVNEVYKSVGVIIATGARPRSLGFEGEAEFKGRGVGYCATCDGEFFTGKTVFVIGAGFAAAEEAIFLTRFASKVIIIAREPEFTCSKTIADKVLANDKIEVKFNTEVAHIKGNNVLKEAKFINNKTQETWEYKVEAPHDTFGVFVFVGYEPISEIFKAHVETDKFGYIPTDEEMQTNIEGIYAAGDIRPKRLRQLVTAVSDGGIASTSVEKYIEHKKEELGIKIEVEEKDHISFLDENTRSQINYVMERCQSKITINAITLKDNKLSDSIKSFLNEFSEVTNKVSINIYEKGENTDLENKLNTDLYPLIALMDKEGRYTGASYHAVPGGHELESFILAIYNVAGPGQTIDNSLLERIKKIDKNIDFKIGISLSCTMCPDLVQAAQRISIFNENITAAMIDLQHYPSLRDKYSIMSVPALIINDNDVLFGKKTLEELVTYIESK